MSNKYFPHLVVIPEDDANRQIIGGFRKHHGVDNRRIHVEPVAGGWRNALAKINIDHAREMGRNGNRYLLVLIDFDDRENRLEVAKKFIPESLSERIFILGCRSEPENIRGQTGKTKEELGEALAAACLSGEVGVWDEDIVAHNHDELVRMNKTICRYLQMQAP